MAAGWEGLGQPDWQHEQRPCLPGQKGPAAEQMPGPQLQGMPLHSPSVQHLLPRIALILTGSTLRMWTKGAQLIEQVTQLAQKLETRPPVCADYS